MKVYKITLNLNYEGQPLILAKDITEACKKATTHVKKLSVGYGEEFTITSVTYEGDVQ